MSWLTEILHIATLGLFANERIHHLIARRRVDSVAFIYTEENKEEVETYRQKYESMSIPVFLREVDPWDFEGIMASILEVVAEVDTEEIEYNLSCGTRVMTSAALMAALVTESKVFFFSEKDGDALGEVIPYNLETIAKLGDGKRRLLAALSMQKNSCGTQNDLINELGIRRAGVSRHLKELTEAGYVDIVEENRPKVYALTKLGEVVLRLKEFRINLWKK